MVKMTNRRIKLGIDWIIKKGETVDEVANTFDVSSRRIEQLVKIFKKPGNIRFWIQKGRPKVHLTEEQKRIIKQAYSESYFGCRMLRHHIIKRHKQNIPQNKIHDIFWKLDSQTWSKKNRKNESRCRYERKHSLSWLHADYMKKREFIDRIWRWCFQEDPFNWGIQKMQRLIML